MEDFLNLSTKLSGFQICIDKGTFDAISLNPDNAVDKRKQFVNSFSRVLEAKGFFLINSVIGPRNSYVVNSAKDLNLLKDCQPLPSALVADLETL